MQVDEAAHIQTYLEEKKMKNPYKKLGLNQKFNIRSKYLQDLGKKSREKVLKHMSKTVEQYPAHCSISAFQVQGWSMDFIFSRHKDHVKELLFVKKDSDSAFVEEPGLEG